MQVKLFPNMKELKRQSAKKYRFDSLNIPISPKISLSQQNDDSCHLPKVKNFVNVPNNQKTLSSLLKRLEKFIQQYTGTSPAILSECLQALKYFIKQITKLPKISGQKALPSESSNSSSMIISKNMDHIFGADSQLLNTKRKDLKKVDSRHLLQRMRNIKQDQNQNNQIIQAKDTKKINALKTKIDDQDKVIRSLNQIIEKQKLHVQNLKLTVHTLMKNDNHQQKQMNYQQKLKELNHQICNLQIIINDKEQQHLKQNKEQQQKGKIIQENLQQLRQALKQRQNQLVSVWQVYQKRPML